MKTNLIAEISQFESRLDALRNQAGVSKSGEVIYKASISIWPERDVVVEADGKGGAILMVVEGNYPTDFIIRVEHSFVSEDEACEAADEMAEVGYPAGRLRSMFRTDVKPHGYDQRRSPIKPQ